MQSAANNLLKRVVRKSADASPLTLTAGSEQPPSPLAELLRRLLVHAVAAVRVAAAETIGRMQLAECAEKLKAALNDAEPAVKIAAQAALAKLASDEPTASTGNVTFLSPAAPPADKPAEVEDVLICSPLGELLHDRNCRHLADWLKTLEFILPQTEQLGALMSLGQFQHLEIQTSGSRILILAAPEGNVMLRVKNNCAAVAAPTGAVVNDALKAQATEWLRHAAFVRGVLLRALRFADQTIVCDVDSRDLTAAALEQACRVVADTFQWLLPRQIPSLQLVWHYDRTTLHSVRRTDKAILVAMATAKTDDLDLPALNRQLAEFQSLAKI